MDESDGSKSLEMFFRRQILPMLYRRGHGLKKLGLHEAGQRYLQAAQGVKDELQLWAKLQD